MKINRLNHTKSLFPHFYDKTDDSNFTKHLKVVGEPQWDIRHKLKTVEWSRILEKPLQIWKEQTQSYVYDMHFKVIVPFLRQVNIYKNPVISADEEVVGYDELCSTESFDYENRIKLYEKVLPNLQTPIYGYDDDNNPLRHRIPKDTYLLEIFTWDDYHFLKGYPENDYTVKEDNILDWRYNESFLSINIEEISYTKYLTFRVHKDKIKQIRIYKNDSLLLNELFDIDIIANSKSTDLSYYYSDDDFTNENTYLQSDFNSYFEVEDAEHNHVKIYVVDTDVDEYVFRLALSDDDFEGGVLKDTYDLEVTTFEKRYRCRQEYDKVYSKRYNGYDEQLNDCFDHDYSLDMIGRLLNVHRFRFYQVYRADDYYLSRTYPTYYDRATEDDYHYMKRMQFYISNYNHIVFPILEFWKYYHTMATIRSRKRIVDEMDYAYLRTNIDDCYIDFDGVEEEFESETVTEYSINKATLTSGESIMVTVEDSVWHEATIVKDVYVVPDINYRLRFGVKDNSEDVTVRMICYNRQGVELRTTPVLEEAMQTSDHEYTSSDGYSYNDLLVVIPSDTVSVKMVLESNGSFSFADATFERMTVVNFDNYYMGTDEDYNSNVYELYCVYEDLPTNLRIGGDRFDILFKRSLPLTKRGFFLVDINDYKSNHVEATTSTELYVKNILMDDEDNEVYQTFGAITNESNEPIVLFEDDCDNASGLTNYDEVVSLENYDGATLAYDDTEKAYVLTSTSRGVKVFPIPALDGLDSFKLSMDIKIPDNSNICGGIACINATEHTGVGVVMDKKYTNNTGVNCHTFKNNTFISNDETSYSGFDSTEYHHMELIVDGYSATWKTYRADNSFLRKKTVSLDSVSEDFTTLSDRKYGLDIGFSNSTTDVCYVKNIRVESLDNAIIFEDSGLSSDNNSNWTTNNNISASVNPNGTQLTSSSSNDLIDSTYYKANELLQGNFEVEFTLVDGYWWTYIVCFRDASNNPLLAIGDLQATSSSAKRINMNTTPSTLESGSYKSVSHTHSYPAQVRVVRVDGIFTITDGETSLSWDTPITDDCYFSFAMSSADSRYTKYRDLKIRSLPKDEHYEATVSYFIDENNTYDLQYFVKSENIIPIYQSDDEDEMEAFIPIITNEELVFTTITYIDSENNEISSDEMEQKIYSNIESHINHQFTTPTDTSKIKITISSETSAELSNIQLSRMEELTDDEVYLNED